MDFEDEFFGDEQGRGFNNNQSCNDGWDRFEQHNHEFTGSTRIAERFEDPHNHRFSGVSGRAISYGRSHVHEIFTRTDSFGHIHFIRVYTGEAIPVGNGKHVHFARGSTSFNDGHLHRYNFATLIENPIGFND
jgi:hypothetical protein